MQGYDQVFHDKAIYSQLMQIYSRLWAIDAKQQKDIAKLSKFWLNMFDLCKLLPDILKSYRKPDMTKTCKVRYTYEKIS